MDTTARRQPPPRSIGGVIVVDRQHIVALGSSFAAGPGIAPVVDRGAMRSGRNYPHLVAQALDARLTDATVSGATTETILRSPQRTTGGRYAPQIEAVDDSADIVTITAGGNDLGYLGGVLLAAVTAPLERRKLTRPISHVLRSRSHVPDQDAVESATSGLVAICDEVRKRSRARVILVAYLPIFDAQPTAEVAARFTADEIATFRRIATQLDDVYLEASRRSGAELVDSSSYGEGHGVGSGDPWVNDLQPVRQLGSSFHPNAEGMRVVADRVVASLTRESHWQ